MTLTGQGYVPLGQGEQAGAGPAKWFVKDNPYHDESGRFTTADGVGATSGNRQNGSVWLAVLRKMIAMKWKTQAILWPKSGSRIGPMLVSYCARSIRRTQNWTP